MAALPRFNWLIGVVSALSFLLASATIAQAVVIGFNVVAPGGDALGSQGDSHTENGFTVTADPLLQFFILGDGFSGATVSNGTAYGAPQRPGDFVKTLTLDGPPSFSIQSIDLGFNFMDGFVGGVVNAVGNFSGGGTIGQSFNVPEAVFQTFLFSGEWTNLDSVAFSFGPENFLAVDNIAVNESVSEVPIPGAVWLFLSALFGLASFSRFQHRRQTT